MKRLTSVLLLLCLWPASIALAADPGEAMNRIEFQVRAEREAANDLSLAILVVESEHSDPARLAADINKTMAWALDQVRASADVRARSGDYRTWPVYNQRRITHWRATQELKLESARTEQLNALIGKLQDRLQVRGMNYAVSPGQRREIEEALTGEALDRFRQRAGAIAERLGASSYDIVLLQVQDDGAQPPQPLMARTMSLPEDAAVASEPGTSRLGVMVNAVIALRF